MGGLRDLYRLLILRIAGARSELPRFGKFRLKIIFWSSWVVVRVPVQWIRGGLGMAASSLWTEARSGYLFALALFDLL